MVINRWVLVQAARRHTMLHSVYSIDAPRALMLQEARDECQQLTREQLDMVVMGQLRTLCQSDPLTQKNKARNSERKRTCTPYHFQGHRVCRDTFVFLHTMSIARLNTIKQSWMENELCPRGQAKVLPHNTTTPFSFPAGYYKRDDLQLLPSSTTKREVWQLYHCTASADADTKAVGYSFFCTFWRKLTPQVVVTRPMSDLCWGCQQNSNMIVRAQNRPVEEKLEVTITYNVYVCTRTFIQHNYIHILSQLLQALRKAEEHLLLVIQKCSVYSEELEESKRQIMSHFVEEGVFVPPPPHAMIVPASNSIMVHYAFDFAQQVHYPSNPL